MNRRELLRAGGQAAAGIAVAAVLPGASPKVHPAIQANIDYWTPMLKELPPYHTTYYGVKEGDAVRVYGVKWNGANPNNAKLFVPDHERELLVELNTARAKSFADIGDTISVNDARTVDCFVYNSPIRQRPKWMPSFASSLLKERFS